MSGRRVALVLGSGGARGYAHIGAIQVLAERELEVVAVAGTSMGALIGGLLAADKVDAYTDWVTTLTQRDVIRLLDPALPGPGAFKAERVLAAMSEMLNGAVIEDLPIPYTAVATDIGARREVWFQSGPLDAAIRASIAVPGMITPVMINGRLLVDGGVLNPVPMEPIIGVDADFTMAINLNGPSANQFNASPAKESAAQRPPNEWLDRFMKTAAGVWENDFIASILARFQRFEATESQDRKPGPGYEPPPSWLGLGDVTSMSLDTMSALITRFRLAALPPDVLVTVPGDTANSMAFHRANELIAIGRALTEAALDDALGQLAQRPEELGPPNDDE